MNLLNRIKRLWELANKDKGILEKLETLSPEEVLSIPESGDGNAVFLGEGTQEEFEEQQKEDKGLKGIFGL